MCSLTICSCDDGYQMGEDEITHATVGLVLNSLDDIHCLTEARHKDTDFLDNILDDDQLHALLNLYDQISTNSYRPFRWANTNIQIDVGCYWLKWTHAMNTNLE